MCNHYRNDPAMIEKLQTWQEYIGWSLDDELPKVASDVWPKRQSMIVRQGNGQKIGNTMQWGVPLTMKGKREGTTVKKRTTNVRNLKSNFWKSMLTKYRPSGSVHVSQPPIESAAQEQTFNSVFYDVREGPI